MIRIARLDLTRWGHFDERSVTFGPAGRLQLLYGGNEAGKSTAGRAIDALLFGVPTRTTDAYGRNYGDLRIGALLELDGVPTEVVRRKGIKDTLHGADGQTLDEGLLTAALGGLAREVYGGLFELTHGTLVEGGEALLRGQGAVGESLFAAAAGSSGLHELLAALEAEADAIYKPRGKVMPLNQALRAHADAVKVLREATLRPPRFEERLAEADALDARHRDGAAELASIEREIRRLQRLRGALPLVERHARLVAGLDALGAVPPLPDGATARREAAQAERERERAAAAAARRERERHGATLATLVIDAALGARGDEVRELAAHAAAIRQDAAAGAELAARLHTADGRMTALMATLAAALGGEPAEPPRLDDHHRERLEACLQDRAAVSTEHAAALTARDEAHRRCEAAVAPPVAADPEPLEAALRAARPAVAHEEAAIRHRGTEAEARRRAAEASSRLRPALEPEALAGVAVPAVAQLDTLIRRAIRLQEEDDEREAEIRRLDARVLELDRERAVLTAGGALPDPGALTGARAERDVLWSAVRAALTAPPQPDHDVLAARFEDASRAADELADEQVRHAEQLACLAAHDRDRAVLDAQREHLAARGRGAAAARDTLIADWSGAWAQAGLTVAPRPAETGAWLAGRDAVLAHLDNAAGAAAAAAAAEGAAAAQRRALAAALARAGAAVQSDVTVAMLVEHAALRLEALREQQAAARRAVEAQERDVAALREAEGRLRSAEAAHRTWAGAWEAARHAAGLDPALTPEAAPAALRRLAEAAAAADAAATLRADLAAVDARRAGFEQAVGTLVGAVAPDLGGRPAAEAAATLAERLASTVDAVAQRERLEREIARLDTEAAEADALAAAAELVIADLCAAVGAGDEAALLDAELRSARAAQLRADVAETETAMMETGGAPRDDVIAAVGALEAEDLDARLAALDADAAARRSEQEDHLGRLTLLRQELARLEDSEAAAQAAQDVAAQLALVRELAERYARARLSQRVLRDAIERYRGAHQGPLLERANELFPALTCRRFRRLVAELDDGDAFVLIAETADGARRRVPELSDGTREQLFLALRLAAIERQIAATGPLPVVLDDVLLESDDERATEILRVLGDLAARTQVIVLTHHRHLVQLSARVLPVERLDVIDLDEVPETLGAPGPDAMPTLADELDALATAVHVLAPGEQSVLL